MTHLPDVFRLISQFEAFSDYKINVTNSELLELTLPIPSRTWARLGLHLQLARILWDQNRPYSQVHLGVKLPPSY